MKKVLFVTYYWPPSGKATLHWPLKVIKHLPGFGWQPSVLTAQKDVFSKEDYSLMKDISPDLRVLRTKSFEPFEIYKRIMGKGKDDVLVASETISSTNTSLAHRLSIWIRMNLFIPDARAGWYFPAISSGLRFLRYYPANAIVSIGPPHTGHLIAMTLSKKFGIPHIPVLIDPWTDIIYYRGFNRSRATKEADNYLEKKVMDNAARVVFVTKSTQEDYIKKYPALGYKSEVLYWGYNEEDFENIKPALKDDTEVLVHAGNIFDYQNPVNFWRQLKKEIDNGRKLKIKFIGSVSPGIKHEIERSGLLPHTEYMGFLQYDEMLMQLMSADYLLVCVTEKRHVPGKLFEYLRTGKPIIAFGNDNDEVKNILTEANAGIMYSYEDAAGDFFSQTPSINTKLEVVKKYDRKNITEKLQKILDELT